MLRPIRSSRSSRTDRSRAGTNALCRTRCSGGSGTGLWRRRPRMAGSPGTAAEREFFATPWLSLPLQDQGGGAVAGGQRAARSVRQREIAVLDLHRRMRLAAQLAHGFDHFGHAAAIGRMVVAQAAAVGVEGQLADAGNQIAVGHERAAVALLAEAEVLDLDQ